MSQICYECGESVKMGSGKFVNRIPTGNTYEENKDMNCAFPRGEYVCADCDEKIRGEI